MKHLLAIALLVTCAACGGKPADNAPPTDTLQPSTTGTTATETGGGPPITTTSTTGTSGTTTTSATTATTATH